MIRRLALVPLAMAAGCLYTGSRNEPPSVTLQVSPTVAYRGQLIVAGYGLTDDQHDIDLVRQRLQVHVLDANRNPVTDPCVATVEPTGGFPQLYVYETGDYFVAADTSDEWGAASTSLMGFRVDDAPPAFKAGAVPRVESSLNACQTYTAGQPIVVDLTAGATDPDGSPALPAGASCPGIDETLVYTWSVTEAPDGAQPRLAPTVAGGCPSAPSDSGPTLEVASSGAQVCLYTDPSVAENVTATYALAVTVSDGVNGPVKAAQQAIMPVRSDQPACILGSQPGAGLRVIDRTVPQTFTITGVADDLDPYPSAQLQFAWSVWRSSDPTWRAVAVYDSSYQLDTSGFDVGEQVQVRAEVVDRSGSRAGCALDVDECLESSCVVATTNSCMRWMTWSLELR